MENLREIVSDLINSNVPKDSKRSFNEALSEFIKSRENNKELASSTIKKYKTLKIHLDALSKRTGTVARLVP